MKPPRKILIVKPSSLGDIANALAIVPRLRTAFPGCEIHWLANSEYRPLVEAGGVDRVLCFERAAWRRWGSVARAARALVALCVALRAERYDAAIDLQSLFRSAWFVWITGAPVRIGFADARECATLFYTDRVEIKRHFAHAVECYLKTLEVMGVPAAPATWEWHGLDACAEAVRRKTGAATGAYFVLVPGSRGWTKQWPSERFAAVAAALWKRYAQPIVLAGGADERVLTEQVAREAVQQGCRAEAITSVAGALSLVELAALCRDCRLLLACDTGPMHLADAVGARVVALMGPTRAVGHGPYRQPGNAVVAHMECVPCQDAREQCRKRPACMETVTVEEVMDKIAVAI